MTAPPSVALGQDETLAIQNEWTELGNRVESGEIQTLIVDLIPYNANTTIAIRPGMIFAGSGLQCRFIAGFRTRGVVDGDKSHNGLGSQGQRRLHPLGSSVPRSERGCYWHAGVRPFDRSPRIKLLERKRTIRRSRFIREHLDGRLARTSHGAGGDVVRRAYSKELRLANHCVQQTVAGRRRRRGRWLCA
jgi:hypothetical protein